MKRKGGERSGKWGNRVEKGLERRKNKVENELEGGKNKVENVVKIEWKIMWKVGKIY